MQQAQMLRELWRMFLRRLPILAFFGIIGIGFSTFVAYVLPAIYESEAKILVESQQIPDQLARSTVTASAGERLQLIQQRLMTRDNLIRLIDTYGLYKSRTDLTVSEKVQQLREATIIRPIALSGRQVRGRQGTEISAFTIRVIYDNPTLAARIANEFVTTVLDQNLRARAERASETLDFFTKEEERLAGSLSALEVEITNFKRDNDGALPESLEFRRDEIARLTAQEFEIDRRVLELAEKKSALEASLRQVAVIEAQAPARTPEEQQLRQLQAELAQLRTTYADSHRRVRAVRAQIAAVEALAPAVPVSTSGEDPAESLRSAQEAGLLQQIAQIDNQVALLEDQKNALSARRTELEGTLQQTPNVEIALNALYRQHRELQEQYTVVARKRTEAETGEKLELNQQAERFEVIENAIVPEKPISPNRKKILVMGSAASLGLAGLIAFLFELLNPAIRSAAQMERVLELKPVVAIPRIRTRSERRGRFLRTVLVLLILGVGVPAGLYYVDQKVMPLQLIGQKFIEKSGMDEIIRMIEARF